MREPPCRPFTISDAMILIAATAVGLTGNRWAGWSIPLHLPAADPVALRYSLMIEEAEIACIPCLAAWTLAFPVLRLRMPRPRLRRVMSQPGMMACSAACLGLAINAGWILIHRVVYPSHPVYDLFYLNGNHITKYAERAGFLIVGSWFALAVTRGWHPVACWIDRLGRALGLAWAGMIGLNLMTSIVFAIHKYWLNRPI